MGDDAAAGRVTLLGKVVLAGPACADPASAGGDLRMRKSSPDVTPSSTSHRLFLVSCVSAKRSQPAPARDLYISPLFLKARAFVEASGSPWFILSAKYGLLAPETVVAPYEQTLNTMPVQERREWAARVLAELLPRLHGIEAVTFLAGQRYREFLEGPLVSRVVVEVPLAGKRIGEQLHWFVDRAGRR